MEVDCRNCGSRCRVEFDPDLTTEEHPLFCPFCGESVDEDFLEEDEAEDELQNYVGRLFEETEPEDE